MCTLLTHMAQPPRCSYHLPLLIRIPRISAILASNSCHWRSISRRRDLATFQMFGKGSTRRALLARLRQTWSRCAATTTCCYLHRRSPLTNQVMSLSNEKRRQRRTVATRSRGRGGLPHHHNKRVRAQRHSPGYTASRPLGRRQFATS